MLWGTSLLRNIIYSHIHCPPLQIGSSDELVVSGIKGPTSSPTSGLAPASLASAAAPTDRHTRPGVLGARQHMTDRSPEQMQVFQILIESKLWLMIIQHPLPNYGKYSSVHNIHVTFNTTASTSTAACYLHPKCYFTIKVC